MRLHVGLIPRYLHFKRTPKEGNIITQFSVEPNGTQMKEFTRASQIKSCQYPHLVYYDAHVTIATPSDVKGSVNHIPTFEADNRLERVFRPRSKIIS